MKKKQRNKTSPQSQQPKKPERSVPEHPVLRFTPTAWAKLLFFRDRRETEIGGFGVTAADDPLLVQEFVTVKQEVTAASVSFEDAAVADHFDAQVDLGRKPEQFARLWLHTHPGDSPVPSATDEETFRRVFGRCQWAVMLILARGGKSFARLRFNVGPGGHAVIPVEVDYSVVFGPSDREAWEAEYGANISAQTRNLPEAGCYGYQPDDLSCYGCPDDWLEELESMEPEERQLVLSELSIRQDLWEEGEVFDELD